MSCLALEAATPGSRASSQDERVRVELSEAESLAALSADHAVIWKSAGQLVSDAQPVLEELLGLDRGARVPDPDAAAALLLTHAQIHGANLIWGTYCGTWAGTCSWACLTTRAHSLNKRIRPQTLAQGGAHAYGMHKPRVIRFCSVVHRSIQALKPNSKVCGLTSRLRWCHCLLELTLHGQSMGGQRFRQPQPRRQSGGPSSC